MLARLIGADGKSVMETNVADVTSELRTPGQSTDGEFIAIRRFRREGIIGPADGGPIAIFREYR